jgi:hypothetical protein
VGKFVRVVLLIAGLLSLYEFVSLGDPVYTVIAVLLVIAETLTECRDRVIYGDS